MLQTLGVAATRNPSNQCFSKARHSEKLLKLPGTSGNFLDLPRNFPVTPSGNLLMWSCIGWSTCSFASIACHPCEFCTKSSRRCGIWRQRSAWRCAALAWFTTSWKRAANLSGVSSPGEICKAMLSVGMVYSFLQACCKLLRRLLPRFYWC